MFNSRRIRVEADAESAQMMRLMTFCGPMRLGTRQRRLHWADKTDAAEARLAHMQRLHQHETLRVTELYQSTQLLHNHLAELRRLGAGVGAAAAGVRPRPSAIDIQGRAPGGPLFYFRLYSSIPWRLLNCFRSAANLNNDPRVFQVMPK